MNTTAGKIAIEGALVPHRIGKNNIALAQANLRYQPVMHGATQFVSKVLRSGHGFDGCLTTK